MARSELVRLLGQYGKTAEVNEEVPPDQIDDWDELIERQESTSDPVYSQQIGVRMTEVLRVLLPKITCLRRLATMWFDARVGSDDEWLIEARIEEVVKDSTDWYELNRLWDDCSYGSIIEGMVSERIAQLISEVSAEECPNWFLVLLRDSFGCIVSDVLKQKIRDLKKELNITD
jgi:hypothetical protein